MEKSSSNGYSNNSLHGIAGNMVIPVTVVIIIVFILRRAVITVLLAGIAVAIAVVVFMIVLVLVAGLVVRLCHAPFPPCASGCEGLASVQGLSLDGSGPSSLLFPDTPNSPM